MVSPGVSEQLRYASHRRIVAAVTDEQEPVTLEAGGRPTTPTTQAQTASPVSLSTIAGLVTALLAIAGAFWFGLLSLAATIAYEPAGVRPREIGLSSGTVLSQSAVGLAAWIGTYMFLLVAYLVAVRTARRFSRQLPKGGDAESSGSTELRRNRAEQRRDFVRGHLSRLTPRLILFTVFLVLAPATYLVLRDAQRAGDALEDGRRAKGPSALTGLPSPWGGEIVELAWAEQKPAGAPALPSCALYLGEAGGTAVFYSATEKRTWRLPSSALILIARPERDRCQN
jgi:hypothetical protein